jgi:hypothetical protein
MLGENQGLIDDKQGEHNIEIESHYEVLSHLMDDFLLQRLRAMTHGIFSLEAAASFLEGEGELSRVRHGK